MAPIRVEPFVIRQKNDKADAAAICEAVARPSMRFVEGKGSADNTNAGGRFKSRIHGPKT